MLDLRLDPLMYGAWSLDLWGLIPWPLGFDCCARPCRSEFSWKNNDFLNENRTWFLHIYTWAKHLTKMLKKTQKTQQQKNIMKKQQRAARSQTWSLDLWSLIPWSLGIDPLTSGCWLLRYTTQIRVFMRKQRFSQWELNTIFAHLYVSKTSGKKAQKKQKNKKVSLKTARLWLAKLSLPALHAGESSSSTIPDASG